MSLAIFAMTVLTILLHDTYSHAEHSVAHLLNSNYSHHFVYEQHGGCQTLQKDFGECSDIT